LAPYTFGNKEIVTRLAPAATILASEWSSTTCLDLFIHYDLFFIFRQFAYYRNRIEGQATLSYFECFTHHSEEDHEQLEHKFIKGNGITLHTVMAGPPDGRLLILLHGFPEFWWGWRHQIPYLTQAGYHVWAPDQRGYNLSDKPRQVAAYNLDELAADVCSLADAAGQERFSVVGHDWGAAVAWWLALKFPERLDSQIIINVPHPAVMSRTLRESQEQRFRSLYAAFFQLPWLPEKLLQWRDWEATWRAMQESSRPGTFSEAEGRQYRRAWSRPGVFTAMLNWYQAILRNPPAAAPSQRVSVPTLIIWGAQDKFLIPEMAHASAELCDDGRLVLVEEATHWIQHEEPALVNSLIDRFLKR
jgi:epoxide hydrolase 4